MRDTTEWYFLMKRAFFLATFLIITSLLYIILFYNPPSSPKPTNLSKDTVSVALTELTESIYQTMEARERQWELRESILQGEVEALLDIITEMKKRENCVQP